MSLEIGDIVELAKLVAEGTSLDVDLPSTVDDFSDAKIPFDLATVTESRDGEPEEHKTEFEAEIASADYSQPNSLVDDTDAGSPSTSAAAPEHLETEGTEEIETEFGAEVTKTKLDLLSEDSDVGRPFDTATELECLESGEGEEVRSRTYAEVASADLNLPDSLVDDNDADRLENREGEQPRRRTYAEVASADLNLPDSLVDGNDAVNLSDLTTVTECNATPFTEGATKEREHLEELVVDNGLDDATEEASKEGDHVEELAVHTEIGDATEGSLLPREEGTRDGVDTVEDTPKDAFVNNKSEPESLFHNTAEIEAREEHHLDKTSINSTLEGAAEYLLHSKQLPLEAGKNVIQLQCESSAPDGVCLVNIIGTAHVSKASCEEVQALIRHVKPEVVFLELCSSRTNILSSSKREVPPTLSSMLESYKKKETNLFGLLLSWFLAKVGETLEVLPGTEFRVAYEEALKCGASVTLGDRPIQITLKRTWGRMSIWNKAKFLSVVLATTFNMPSADEFQVLMEKMEQSDELTIMVQELSKTFPSILETVVVERDLYMVASLRAVARRYSSVVAVVGRGHLSGIAKNWKEDICVEELLALPNKKFSSRKWLWGALALGVGGIVVSAHYMRRR